MPSVSPGARTKIGLILQTLLASVLLRDFEAEAFLFQKNRTTASHSPLNYAPSRRIPRSYLLNFEARHGRQSSWSTHVDNEYRNCSVNEAAQPPDQKHEHILAVLCSNYRKVEVLRGVLDSISQDSCKIKRILYVTSEDQIEAAVEALSDPKQGRKVDVISPQTVSLYKQSAVTVGAYSTLLQYYDFLNNEAKFTEPKILLLEGRRVGVKRMPSLRELLVSRLDSFLMKGEEIAALPPIQEPKTTMNAELMESARQWVERNHADSEEVVEFVRGVDKAGLVVLDGFRCRYDHHTNSTTCEFKDKLVALLRSDCALLGTTSQMYNPEHAARWLGRLLGPVKLVSMSRSPKFELLSSYGSLDIFGTPTYVQPPGLGANFSRPRSNSMEVYKYFSKKSNIPTLTGLNPDLSVVLVRVIVDALKSIGVTTYWKMIRMSQNARGVFKHYVRKLRRTPDFDRSPDKMEHILRQIINVPENKMMAKFTRESKLNPIIREQQRPPVPNLLGYIEQRGLFPAVVYKFGPDWSELVSGFDEHLKSLEPAGSGAESVGVDLPECAEGLGEERRRLLERGVCTLLDTDGPEFKAFVRAELPKFRLVISNEAVPGARHYLLMDSCFRTEGGCSAIANDQLYSLTQGSELVTLTLDPDYTFHTIRSLLSPVYLNLANLEPSAEQPYSFEEALAGRTFGAYLRACSAAYSQESSFFEKKKRHAQLGEMLADSQVDVDQFMRVSRDAKRLEGEMETLSYSLNSKLGFRRHILDIMLPKFNFRGSVVLGIDLKRYRLLRQGTDPLDWFKFENEEAKLKFDDTAPWLEEKQLLLLLENEGDGSYVLAKTDFLRDIVELGDPETVSEEPVSVGDFKKVTLEVANDLPDYLNVQPFSVTCIKIGGDTSPQTIPISSLLSEQSRLRLFEQIREHKGDARSIEAIFNPEGNESKSKVGGGRVESNWSNQHMFGEDSRGPWDTRAGSRSPGRAGVEHGSPWTSPGTASPQNLRSAAEEYAGLDKALRNARLEHILSQYRFKRSFWGTGPVN